MSVKRDKEKRNVINQRYYTKHKKKERARSRKYYASHKEQRSTYNAEHVVERKMYHAAYFLRRWYGMSLEDYHSLLASQGGVCKICGATEPGRKAWRFSVDHNHETGVIRGLLCINCNVLLGAAREDLSILASAGLYLQGVI